PRCRTGSSGSSGIRRLGTTPARGWNGGTIPPPQRHRVANPTLAGTHEAFGAGPPPMIPSSTTAGHRGVPRGWLLAAGLVALSYFCTSLVVVVNARGNATGIVWLPSFPSGYYLFSHWLYCPFQWYFALLPPLPPHPPPSSL